MRYLIIFYLIFQLTPSSKCQRFMLRSETSMLSLSMDIAKKDSYFKIHVDGTPILYKRKNPNFIRFKVYPITLGFGGHLEFKSLNLGFIPTIGIENFRFPIENPYRNNSEADIDIYTTMGIQIRIPLIFGVRIWRHPKTQSSLTLKVGIEYIYSTFAKANLVNSTGEVVFQDEYTTRYFKEVYKMSGHSSQIITGFTIWTQKYFGLSLEQHIRFIKHPNTSILYSAIQFKVIRLIPLHKSSYNKIYID